MAEAEDVEKLEAMVEKLTEQVMEVEVERDEARDGLAALQTSVRQLEGQLSDAQAQLQEAKKPSADVAALQSQNDRLRQALIALRDKVGERTRLFKLFFFLSVFRESVVSSSRTPTTVPPAPVHPRSPSAKKRRPRKKSAQRKPQRTKRGRRWTRRHRTKPCWSG